MNITDGYRYVRVYGVYVVEQLNDIFSKVGTIAALQKLPMPSFVAQ